MAGRFGKHRPLPPREVLDARTAGRLARDLQRAEALAAELRQKNHAATALCLDRADLTSVREAAERVTRAFDHLDVLINHAPHRPDFRTRSALDVEIEAVSASYAVDAIGCWALIRAMLPLLRKSSPARIVNVSTDGALQIARPGPCLSLPHLHSPSTRSTS